MVRNAFSLSIPGAPSLSTTDEIRLHASNDGCFQQQRPETVGKIAWNIAMAGREAAGAKEELRGGRWRRRGGAGRLAELGRERAGFGVFGVLAERILQQASRGGAVAAGQRYAGQADAGGG